MVLFTHCSIPNRMKVPPSMMNPAGKIAFTPHMERYLPTSGPAKYRVKMVAFTQSQFYLTKHEQGQMNDPKHRPEL